MNNIFEGAKFGDKFVTRTNLIAIFVKEGKNSYQPWYKCIINDIHNDEYVEYYYHKDGRMTSSVEDDLDIVSRYHEPIDEDMLNVFAYDYWKHHFGDDEMENAYKAGYRKAKEQ